MSTSGFFEAMDRATLRVSGPEARSFLQGLMSNDVERVGLGQAIWAALLTPQGRWLHDVFIASHQEALILDVERARAEDLAKRLARYRLRAAVAIDGADDCSVFVGFGPDAAGRVGLEESAAGAAAEWAGGVVFVDPRTAALGVRALLPSITGAAALREAGFVAMAPTGYERARILAGAPAGARDLEPEKALLLENGFDRLNGVSFSKGCYVGQEVTARMRYRGPVKRVLVPVRVLGAIPAAGTPVFAGEREAGEMLSGIEDVALARVRVEDLRAALAGTAMLATADARLLPELPPGLVIDAA